MQSGTGSDNAWLVFEIHNVHSRQMTVQQKVRFNNWFP